MYHVPIVRNSFGNVCYDPITAGLIIAGTAATAATVHQGTDAAKAASNASANALARQDKAAAQLATDQANAASQAQQSVEQRKRRVLQGSKSVYTSPLGISGTASLARKTLLGQ